MIDKIRLGNEIKSLRKSKKISQMKLSEGICNQSEISRIESGEFFPSLEILYLISNKLQVPISYFFEILVHKELEETRAIKKQVMTFSAKKNYEEMYKYIEKVMLENGSNNLEMQKFLLWNKTLAAYYLKKIDVDFCLTELFLLLKKKYLGIDLLLDLNIKNTIANVLAENKNYAKSKDIYRDILKINLKDIETDKLKIKVLYNLGKLLYLEKNYEEALIQTEKGIKLSIESTNMTLLGHFYFQKGSILEEIQKSFEEISTAYQKAYFFFNLLDLNIYEKILIEKKSQYLTWNF